MWGDVMLDMVDNEAEARKIRNAFHKKIDRLPASSAPAAERLLLRAEVEHLRQELNSAFDQDRAQSKLSPQKVSNAIASRLSRGSL
jgi:hypothetical protein